MNPLSTIENSKVILSALDWGFGHTTRLIVIIKSLLEKNNKVHFAGTKEQIEFFENEFEGITYHNLKGYRITLNDKKKTYWQLYFQKNKALKLIAEEEYYLKQLHEKEKFDYVVSDNRYGFRLKTIPSFVICHQLNLQVPFAKKIANSIHNNLLSKFTACLVPDHQDQLLTGELSTSSLKIPVHYIGPLCRFEKLDEEIEYDYTFIVSGPEPARTNFINSIKRWIKENPEKKIAVIGTSLVGTENCKSFIKLRTDELNRIISKSEEVVSRAGYTSIMELYTLKKKSTLIPTKGQFEQEYLASFIKTDFLSFKNETEFF